MEGEWNKTVSSLPGKDSDLVSSSSASQEFLREGVVLSQGGCEAGEEIESSDGSVAEGCFLSSDNSGGAVETHGSGCSRYSMTSTGLGTMDWRASPDTTVRDWSGSPGNLGTWD